MTEVQFHFNAEDRLAYTCRLLRKATRLGNCVDVVAEAAVLADLDKLLWVFDAQEFVPHTRVRPNQSLSAAQRHAPVWLMEAAAEATVPSAARSQPVLLNLGRDPVPGFDAYERLIEVVATDADDRAAARTRWKRYTGLGHAVVGHEVAA